MRELFKFLLLVLLVIWALLSGRRWIRQVAPSSVTYQTRYNQLSVSNSSATPNTFNCGCPKTCDASALAKKNTGLPFSCQQRIEYLITRYGNPEWKACAVAVQQSACGNECSPDQCLSSTASVFGQNVSTTTREPNIFFRTFEDTLWFFRKYLEWFLTKVTSDGKKNEIGAYDQIGLPPIKNVTALHDNGDEENTPRASAVESFQSLLLDKKEKVFLFELGEFSGYHGLGSLTISMLLLKLYLEDTQGRKKMVLDQSRLQQYRLNETHGLYSGFLETDFPVLDDIHDLEKVQTLVQQENSSLPNVFVEPPQGILDKSTQAPVLKISHRSLQSWQRFLAARGTALNYYMDQTESNDKQHHILPSTFGRLSESACSIWMNNDTNAAIQNVFQNASISFLHNDSTSIAENASVSFHIRRGDKVGGHKPESRAFEAYEYVDVLVQAISESEKQLLKYCFVATDSYPVVEELGAALRNASIPCALHTLANTNYMSDRNGGHALSFLAEMKMLIDATFFVGSFSSNVGALVTLWRGCPKGRQIGATEMNKFHHYFRSYGVDSADWFVM